MCGSQDQCTQACLNTFKQPVHVSVRAKTLPGEYTLAAAASQGCVTHPTYRHRLS